MKRSGEIQRKTPLKASKGLSSRSVLVRSAPLRAKLSTKKAAKRSTGPKRSVVDLVLARDGYGCVRCRKHAYGERGLDWSVHHRDGRRMGGTRRASVNAPSNLVILCGSGTTGCHGWVGQNVTEAYRVGLLVLSGLDPATVVLTTWWGHVLLDDEGRWTEVPS